MKVVRLHLMSVGSILAHMLEPTHGGNDLGFQAVLVGESSSKIADSTSTIASDVRYLSDMVKHMSTGEKKNSNQADSGPNVTVLNYG